MVACDSPSAGVTCSHGDSHPSFALRRRLGGLERRGLCRELVECERARSESRLRSWSRVQFESRRLPLRLRFAMPRLLLLPDWRVRLAAARELVWRIAFSRHVTAISGRPRQPPRPLPSPCRAPREGAFRTQASLRRAQQAPRALRTRLRRSRFPSPPLKGRGSSRPPNSAAPSRCVPPRSRPQSDRSSRGHRPAD